MKFKKALLIAILLAITCINFASVEAIPITYSDNNNCNAGNCNINTSYYYIEMRNGSIYKYNSYVTDKSITSWTNEPTSIGQSFMGIFTSGWVVDNYATSTVSCGFSQSNNDYIFANCTYDAVNNDFAYINYTFYPSYIKADIKFTSPDTAGGSIYFFQKNNGTTSGLLYNHSMALNESNILTGAAWTDSDSAAGLIGYAWLPESAPTNSAQNTTGILIIDYNQSITTDFDYGAGNPSTSYGGLSIGRSTSFPNNTIMTVYIKVLPRNESGSTNTQKYTTTMNAFSSDKTYGDNAPIITLVSPINASTNTSFITNFIFNVSSDTRTISGCSLYIDGISNKTINNVVEDTNQIINVNFTSNKNFNWSIQCTDSSGISNSSSTRAYSIAYNGITTASSSISQTVAYANTTIQGYCQVDATSNVSYDYKWYINGVEYSSGTIPANVYQETGDALQSDCSSYPNVVDGSYSTSEDQPFCHLNYTKPSASIGALWNIKDECGTANVTVTRSCWNALPTSLAFYIDEPAGDIFWKCYSGSYNSIRHCAGSFGTAYEESVYWQIGMQPMISINIANLSAIADKDDIVNFACRATDGQNTSNWLNSTNLTISSYPPHNLTANITQQTYYANSTIIANCTAFDIDSDTVSYNYAWYLNGQFNYSGTSETSLITLSSQKQKGQNWSIICLATDSAYSRGLVSEWRFENNTNDTMLINNGITVGTITTNNGFVGNSYYWNGVSGNYIKVPDSNSLDLTTAITICLWNKRNTTGNLEHLISKFNTTNSERGYFMSHLQTPSDTTSFTLTNAAGSSAPSANAQQNNVNQAGTWYFECGAWSYNTNSGRIRIYTNGAETNYYLNGSSTSTIKANSQDLWIGSYHSDTTRTMNGTIDEVTIWNRQLSASEISSLYTNYLSGIRTTDLYVNRQSNTIIISNSPPIVANITITPTPATALDNLTCTFDSSDIDGDAITYAYNWTINDVISNFHQQNLTANYTENGYNITCSVLPSDSENGTMVTSPLVNIGDGIAPTISYISIDETSGTTSETHTLYINCSDDSSGIGTGYPKVSYVDPNGITQGNFTFNLLADNQYYYSTSFAVVGRYTNFIFYCADSQSNLATNSTNSISFTSSAPANSGSGGGGGPDGNTIKNCRWSFDQKNVTFYEGDFAKRLLLTNNENSSITPKYSITGKLFSVAGSKSLLSGGSTIELTVLRDRLQSSADNVKEKFTVSSSECLPITVNIEFINDYEKLTAATAVSGALEGATKKLVEDIDLFGLEFPFYWITIITIVIVGFVVSLANTSLIGKISSGMLIIIFVNIVLASMLPSVVGVPVSKETGAFVVTNVKGNLPMVYTNTNTLVTATEKVDENFNFVKDVFGKTIVNTNVQGKSLSIKMWTITLTSAVVIIGLLLLIEIVPALASFIIGILASVVITILLYYVI